MLRAILLIDFLLVPSLDISSAHAFTAYNTSSVTNKGRTPSGIRFDRKNEKIVLRDRFSISISRTLLPTLLFDGTESLLSAPVRLEMYRSGRLLTFDKEKMEVLASSEDSLRLSSTLTEPQASMASVLQVEPDGFMYYSFDFSCGEMCDSVVLVLAFESSHARHLQYYPLHWPPDNIKDIPEKQGPFFWAPQFIPYFWIGDDDRGLLWFCESQRGWSLPAGHNFVEISVIGESVIVRVAFRATGTFAAHPLHLEFGFQLTPVSDVPLPVHRSRMAPSYEANIDVQWPSPKVMKYYGLPDALEPKDFRRNVLARKKQGRDVLSYTCLTYVSAAVESVRDSIKSWEIPGLSDATGSDVKEFGASFLGVCPASDGWRGFIIARLVRAAQQYDLDGYYIDNAVVFGCRNTLHGCGYSEGGALHPTYPFRAYRRIFKDLRSSMTAARGGRPPYLLAHLSGRMTACIFPFIDGYLSGEQFKTSYDGSYIKLIPPAHFRAEFVGNPWGVNAFFLPTFGPGFQGKKETTDEILAYALLHNVSIWPLWCDVQEYNRIERLLIDSGIEQSSFVPYWKSNPMDKILQSVYRSPRALVVVCVNATDTAVRWGFESIQRELSTRNRRRVLELIANETIDFSTVPTVEFGPYDSKIFILRD